MTIEHKPKTSDPLSSARIQASNLLWARVTWIIAWPFIVILISILILIVGTNLAFRVLNLGLDWYGIIRLYFALFVAALAFTCLLLIKKLSKNERFFLRSGASVLRVYTWLGVSVGAILLLAIPDVSKQVTSTGINTQTSATPFVPTVAHDDSIAAVLRELGVKDEQQSNINEQYVSGFTANDLSDKEGEYRAYLGYDGKFLYGDLKVKTGLTNDEQKVVVAHEFLHHIWFTQIENNSQLRDRLTSDLITMYGKDYNMQKRIGEYSSHGILKPTELFSYYCTESSDGYLTEYVLNACNQYINRGAISFLR